VAETEPSFRPLGRGTDRRTARPGARCPECGEFVEQRWAVADGDRLTYVCWSGHRWVDRRAAPIRYRDN